MCDKSGSYTITQNRKGPIHLQDNTTTGCTTNTPEIEQIGLGNRCMQNH